MSTIEIIVDTYDVLVMYNFDSIFTIKGLRMATSSTKKVRSADGKRLALRQNFWPDVPDKYLWLRKDRVGFTTIPRTMSLIGRIMDQLAGKGFPVFGTYLALWCRVYDEGFVEIRSDREMAFESGFSGTRGEVTWRSRMRKLHDLGFIDIHAGLASDMQYILLLNPIRIIEFIYRFDTPSQLNDQAYVALRARLIEVGANDLDDPDPNEEPTHNTDKISTGISSFPQPLRRIRLRSM